MFSPSSRWSPRIVTVTCLLGLTMILQPAGPVRADDQDLGSTFARVRHVDGGLTVQRTAEGELTQALPNSPLVPGDVAWTDDGRAEIELADGSVLYLDQGTRIDLRNLADLNNRYEKTNLVALEQGSVRIETQEPGSTDQVFQVDTEGGSVYLLSGGIFRIDADGSVASVSSFRGVAELSGDAGSVLVRSGERSSVSRGGAPADPRPFNTLRLDDFDRFCADRGRAYVRQEGEEPPASLEQDLPSEVHPYVRELSVYGDWRQVPDYGWVWRPAYSGSWGPYLYGDWVFSPTGWVWVSYDPWGWAPYHYGRWDFVVDVGWVWIPGRIWSGAWVSFAVGSSYIGWCPLDFYNRPVFTDVRAVNVVNVNVTRLDPRGWRFTQTARFGSRRGDRAVIRPNRLPRGSEVVLSGRLPQFNPKEIASRPEAAARLVERVRASRVAPPIATSASGRPLPFRNLERVPEPVRARARGNAAGGRAAGPAPTRPSPGRMIGGGPVPPRGQPRDRAMSRSDDPSAMPQPGPGRPSVRGGAREPRGRGAFRQPTTGQRPRTQGPTPPPQPERQEAGDAADRPRGHAVERLFDGVRRERQPERAAPPSRPAAPPAHAAAPERARPAAPPPKKPRADEGKPDHPSRGGHHY